MKKRFAVFEIGILVFSILALSFVMIAHAEPKSITGYGFFDVYSSTNPEDSNLETPDIPTAPCASSGGKCISKFFGTLCSGTKSLSYSCSGANQICCFSRVPNPAPVIDSQISESENKETKYDSSGNLIYELLNEGTDLIIGKNYTLETTDSGEIEIQDIITRTTVEGSRRVCGCKSTCTDSSSCKQETTRVLINGGWENALSCKGKCTGEDCGSCRWRTASADKTVPTTEYKGILGNAYIEAQPEANIFAGYEVEYDDSGKLIYELTNARTNLTVGDKITVNKTGNTLTIYAPSEGKKKKVVCRCKTKTGVAGNCESTTGCTVEKMKSGPYYGCYGMCRGDSCSGGCTYYDADNDVVGDLIHT